MFAVPCGSQSGSGSPMERDTDDTETLWESNEISERLREHRRSETFTAATRPCTSSPRNDSGSRVKARSGSRSRQSDVFVLTHHDQARQGLALEPR